MKSRIIHALLFGLIFSTVFTTISLFTPPVTKFKCDSQLFSSNLYFIGASKDYSDINIGKVNCGVYPYKVNITVPADHMVGATGFLIANLVLKRKSAKKLK